LNAAKEKPTMKAIPKSLLDLLALEWKPATQGAFESIFAERGHEPSFYFASEGEPPAIDMLCFNEVTALIGDGVLTDVTGAVRRRPSGHRYTATNEHAQHAIYDFCETVYAAWSQLQQRLTTAEQASRTRANSGHDDCTQAQRPLVTH
jgi:hypothetical protein